MSRQGRKERRRVSPQHAAGWPGYPNSSYYVDEQGQATLLPGQSGSSQHSHSNGSSYQAAAPGSSSGQEPSGYYQHDYSQTPSATYSTYTPPLSNGLSTNPSNPGPNLSQPSCPNSVDTNYGSWSSTAQDVDNNTMSQQSQQHWRPDYHEDRSREWIERNNTTPRNVEVRNAIANVNRRIPASSQNGRNGQYPSEVELSDDTTGEERGSSSSRRGRRDRSNATNRSGRRSRRSGH